MATTAPSAPLDGPKVTVELSTLRAHLAYRRLINQTHIRNVIWTDGGQILTPRPEDIEEFRFMGLNTIDFARVYLLSDDE